MKYQFKVENMKCEHCAKRVKDALEKNPNVKRVEVDLSSKTVLVEGEKLDLELLSSTIEDLGYEVKSCKEDLE